MSFSDVDASPDPDRLVGYLEVVAPRLAPIKALLRSLARQGPNRRVLDLGCGTGFDVAALSDDAFEPVGVEPSRAMLRAAARRGGAAGAPLRLVAARGEALPFGAGVFGGCIADRVLQHVHHPPAVLSEVRRVLAPGGVIAVFEPDWESLAFDTADPETAAAVVSQVVAGVAQRRIGIQLRRLLVEAGFTSVVVAPEPVCAESLEALRRVANLDAAADRAVSKGLAPAGAVERFLTDLADSSAGGAFTAVMNRYIAAGVRRR